MGNRQGGDEDRVRGEREVAHPALRRRADEGHNDQEVDQFGDQCAQGGAGLFQVIDPGAAAPTIRSGQRPEDDIAP